MHALIILLLFIWHLVLVISGLFWCFSHGQDSFCESCSIWIDVALWGLVGGCIYCTRGLYLQYCAKKEWDNRWIVWHIIRPVVSAAAGVLSLLFVKAGLIVFEASSLNTANNYGVYAFAFIAGLNVDNFIKKIESIFEEILGIKKTRTSRGEKQ